GPPCCPERLARAVRPSRHRSGVRGAARRWVCCRRHPGLAPPGCIRGVGPRREARRRTTGRCARPGPRRRRAPAATPRRCVGDSTPVHPGGTSGPAHPHPRGGGLVMIAWHVLTGEYPPQAGGVSDYTFLLAQSLAAAADTVTVWAPRGKQP